MLYDEVEKLNFRQAEDFINQNYNLLKEHILKDNGFNKGLTNSLNKSLILYRKFKDGFSIKLDTFTKLLNELFEADITYEQSLLYNYVLLYKDKNQKINLIKKHICKCNTIKSKENLHSILKHFINSSKLDKNFLKYEYAKVGYELALAYKQTPQSFAFLRTSLVIFKELNSKQEYEKCLLLQKQLMPNILNSMCAIEHVFDEQLQKCINVAIKLKRDFFSDLLYEDDIIKFLSSCRINFNTKVIVKGKEEKEINYKPYCISTQVNKSNINLSDLISVSTFNENRLVETVSHEQFVEINARVFHRVLDIIPSIEGIIMNPHININKLINEILAYSLIRNEDKKHINLALVSFFNKDYDIFIYIIVPNLEKLLRNMVDVEYENKNSNAETQVIKSLTTIIKEIKEKEILNKFVIDYIEKKLNNEQYENYRNILSHRISDEIFTKDVAYELFHLLLLICGQNEYKNTYILEIKR